MTIFMFSHQNGEKTKETSDIIAGPINENVGKDLDFGLIVRKGAHLFEYTILGLLVILWLSTFLLNIKLQIVFTFIFGFIYALSDEWHQTYIPGRYGSFKDVLIDGGGIIMGIFLFTLFYHLKQKALNKNLYDT